VVNVGQAFTHHEFLTTHQAMHAISQPSQNLNRNATAGPSCLIMMSMRGGNNGFDDWNTDFGYSNS